MMSLIQNKVQKNTVIHVNFLEAVKKQYHYKLHAHHSMFGTMIIMQIIAGLLTFSNQIYSVNSNNIDITVRIISADLIIGLTFLWIIIMAFQLTTKASKNKMVTFVTSKQTNHLANILFMITLCFIGGLTANLLGAFVKMVVSVMDQTDPFIYFAGTSVSEFATGILATIAYMLLIASFFYLIGEIVQIHSILIIIIPSVLVGLLFILGVNVEPIIGFYIFTKSLSIMLVKTLVTAFLLFFAATLFGNRLEVRR